MTLLIILAALQAAPAFDVASVKINSDTILTMSGVVTQPGGRLSAKATTLKDLVVAAYGVQLREVQGGPDWMTVDRFDIEARAAADATPAQLREMLKSLLSERFGLRIRRESRMVDAYALVTGRNGLRLKVSDPTACGPERDPCSGPVVFVGRMIAGDTSMDQLAAAMSTFMDRPVANRTERPGFFAGLKLDWVPDESQYAQYGPGVWARPRSDPSGPALSTALQEQLGLRLEPTRASIEVIVVETANRPTPN